VSGLQRKHQHPQRSVEQRRAAAVVAASICAFASTKVAVFALLTALAVMLPNYQTLMLSPPEYLGKSTA